MSILNEIIAHTRADVARRKELKPVKLLESSIYYETPVVSMCAYLQRPDRSGIIAEIKRRSPSAGMIREFIDVEQLSIGYMQAGASALSVLSNGHYFGGSNDDVTTARRFNYCPILRKEFIVDPYQVIETKSIGADTLLLIASALTPAECAELARLARAIGLEVLLEVHSREEIDAYATPDIQLIGVNNRNLHDFQTGLDASLELARHIPGGFVKVSESGLDSASQIAALRQSGYQGFLIGTHFMREAHPEEACARLIRELQALPA